MPEIGKVMPITQTQIVAQIDQLKEDIIGLKQQLKEKEILLSAWNKVSAQLGGRPPGKRRAMPKIKKKCTIRGCSRKGHVFTTQSAYSRHFNAEHGEVGLHEVA